LGLVIIKVAWNSQGYLLSLCGIQNLRAYCIMGCFTSGSLSPDYITDDHTIGDATVILFLLFAMVCLLILIGALCRYLKNQNFNADSNS